MARWRSLAGILLLQMFARSQAVEMKVDQKDANRQVCQGMYSKKAWGGNTDPFILTKFIHPENIPEGEDPIVSLVVFEWKDKDMIGQPVPPPDDVSLDNADAEEILKLTDTIQRVYICDPGNVDAGHCDKDDIGSFITADNTTENAISQVISMAIHLKDPPAVNYPIKHTGYYCVGTFGYNDEDYSAIVEFRNAFGELPAAQIAKLPFYSSMTIVYALMGIGWGALYYLNRHDILAVQNYITAIIVFLVIEMFMTWLFYDYQNRHGFNTGAKVLLVVVSILSAARNSFSFFLLLIVCMGYGVVKHSLGKTMIYVRWLAITHFAFGVIYAVASLSITPENAGPLVLLVVLPLAATLTAFYIWTLNSLNLTLKDLMERKQTVKAAMYRKLWWCILASILIIFAFFFVNSWTFAGQSSENFVPNHWSTRWFILDGWLNLVYFADVAFIAYVWRPTANNRRFAMSDEIAQDDDGFDLASRDSLDLGSDLEVGSPTSKPPAYDGPASTSRTRDASPLPAPVPQKPASALPRASLETDTMFALEDERDSDDDESDEEGKRLTGAGR